MKSYRLIYEDGHSLLLVNRTGTLRRIVTPFQVKCIQPTGTLKKDQLMFVEGVGQNKDNRILYFILGNWYPYDRFSLFGY